MAADSSDPNLPHEPNALTILVVATEWESRHGGISSFNRALCDALAQIGQNVICMVPQRLEHESSDAKKRGVRLVAPRNVPQDLDDQVLFLRPALPKGTKIDWIIGHAHITGAAALAQQRLRPRSGPRRLHIVHVAPGLTEWFKSRNDGSSAARRAEQREQLEIALAQRADLIAAVGPLLQREMQNMVGGRQNVHCLRPGINFSGTATREAPGGSHCLLVARAEDATLKGLDIAARAVAYVDRRRRELFPALVVRGAELGRADELRRELVRAGGRPGIDVRVREYSTNAADLERDFRRAQVAMMPSRTEGFGLVALEALSHGVPLLASRSSGFAEFVVQQLGPAANQLLVPVVDDAEIDGRAWGRAVLRVLENPSGAMLAMGELRRGLAEKVSWRQTARELVDAMRAVDERKASHVSCRVPGPVRARTEVPSSAVSARAAPVTSYPVVRWRKYVGIGTWKTKPIICEKRLFVPVAGAAWNMPDSDDGVVCVEMDSGDVLWRARTPGDANAALLDDGTIYVGTDAGRVVAIDAAGGSVRWTARVSGPVLARPTRIGELLIVVTASGALHELDRADGSVRESSVLPSGAVADPLLHQDRLYIFARDGTVRRFDAATKLERHTERVRTFTYPTPFGPPGLAICGFAGSPVVFGSKIVAPFLRDTYYSGVPLLALEPESLEETWNTAMHSAQPERNFGNVRGTPVVVSDECLVVGVSYGNEIIGCSANGTLSWVTECGVPFFPQYGSPAAIGTISLTPRFDGSLHAVDVNGRQLWSLTPGHTLADDDVRGGSFVVSKPPEWINAAHPPLNSPCTVDGSSAYVLSADGYLYRVDVDEVSGVPASTHLHVVE